MHGKNQTINLFLMLTFDRLIIHDRLQKIHILDDLQNTRYFTEFKFHTIMVGACYCILKETVKTLPVYT